MINLRNSFKGKNIVVTGASGFKGAWLCEILLLLGANVYGYALAPDTDSLFKKAGLARKINFLEADIRDLSKLTDFVKKANPDYIIHMAAQPLVIDSYKRPVYTYEVNVMGTVNILESMKQLYKKVSFLNVTTDKVYENNETGDAFVEDDKLNGKDPYANSKSCSELVTSSYKFAFFEDRLISTARAGNVIGGGDISANRIIPDCQRAIASNSVLEIRNPGSIRPYEHVLDPLNAYLMILASQYEDKKYEGSYNVAPDLADCITTKELVELFKKHFDGNFEYKINAPKDVLEKESTFLRLSNEKLKKVFGWKPLMNIDTAVKETALFFKDELGGANVTDLMEKQIKNYISMS